MTEDRAEDQLAPGVASPLDGPAPSGRGGGISTAEPHPTEERAPAAGTGAGDDSSPGDDSAPGDENATRQKTAEELARHVARRPLVREVDPEDWARSGGSDDDRYLRDVPPHWG